MIGAVEPNWSGDGSLHASPLFTFAGIALVYTPMKLGHGGDLPAALRGRTLAPRRGGAASEGGVPGARYGAPAHRPPALHRRRPLVGGDVLGGSAPLAPPTSSSACRTRCPTPWCRRLRHDRGRLGVLHHAEGRGRQAARLGGTDRPAGGRADRRRRRPAVAARRGGGGTPPDARPSTRVLRGPRGDGRDLAGRLAGHR